MVKANLTEVRDLGMKVNRLNPEELVDHCILRFQTEQGTFFETYPLSKTCHASSKLGKILRTLLRRKLTKDDYDSNDMFESDTLLGTEAFLDISDSNIIIGVYEAEEPLF